jgi:hypothetical protein
VRLDRLLGNLQIAPAGTKGYSELHKMRNLVQHEGVLPAPEELPRWLTETEQLADALIAATFGVSLNEVGSAAAVQDEELRPLLEEAEAALEGGEPENSFDASWQALDLARRLFRQRTGLHQTAPSIGTSYQSLMRQDKDLGALLTEVRKLAEQVELSAFTAEPGEWLWFKQRQGERFRGLPPSLPDASRAFVFALSWILWFESYIARHGVDRWDRWREEQRAPSTGLPGGPHIRDVKLGNRPSASGGRVEGLRNWIFELTDVPETQPSFDWAVHAVVSEIEDSSLTNAWLDESGQLSISCPQTDDAATVRASVLELLSAAKVKLSQRATEDAEDDRVRERIIARFRSGLSDAGCPVQDLQVTMPRNKHRIEACEAQVRIVFEGEDDSGPSWLAKGFEETFERHFPEHAAPGLRPPAPYESRWNDLFVPALWASKRVGRWACDAIAFDAEKRANEAQDRQATTSSEIAALSELKRLIDAD